MDLDLEFSLKIDDGAFSEIGNARDFGSWTRMVSRVNFDSSCSGGSGGKEIYAV